MTLVHRALDVYRVIGPALRKPIACGRALRQRPRDAALFCSNANDQATGEVARYFFLNKHL